MKTKHFRFIKNSAAISSDFLYTNVAYLNTQKNFTITDHTAVFSEII